MIVVLIYYLAIIYDSIVCVEASNGVNIPRGIDSVVGYIKERISCC